MSILIKKTSLTLLISSVFLLGCSNNEARHVPPLWKMPTAMIGNAIGNTIYGAKRDAIKKYIVQHYDDLNTEIKMGDGYHLDHILQRMSVKKDDVQATKNQLQNDYVAMFENIDIITESIMNQYAFLYIATSSEKTKTINGFSYTAASNIIKQYLRDDFSRFKTALKEKNISHIEPLLNALNIQETQNRATLRDYIFTQYDQYVIEPVVVGIMVIT